MAVTWRVIAFEADGARIIIDEALSEERAKEIRELMASKGHKAVVEPEVQYQLN